MPNSISLASAGTMVGSPLERSASRFGNGSGPKLTTLTEAAGLVSDGDVVAIGGCLYSRTPWAMLLELLRCRKRDLTLTRSLMCYEAELFLARGAATRIVTSWVGIGLRWGIPKVFRELIETGSATYEEWSHLALGLRFQAAAMGVPFLPTRSLLGSDLMTTTDAREATCPFTGETLCLVPALAPDVALLHVQRADRHGNAQIDGSPYLDRELASAGKRVVLTTECVVDDAEITASPDRTSIPHFLVDAVVEVPFGSFPHECHGLYDAWFSHFEDYMGLVNAEGLAGVETYLREHLDDAGSFSGFLAKVGETVLKDRQRTATLLASVSK